MSVTNDKMLLSNYYEDEGRGSNVYSATKSKLDVVGIGNIVLTLGEGENEKVIKIPTLHCPNIIGTYISEYDLICEGIDYRSVGGKPHLFWKDGMVKLHRNRKSIEIPKCLIVRDAPSGSYIAGIHQALGHVQTEQAIKSLRDGYIRMAKDEDENYKKADTCDECMVAKARRCDHKVGSRDEYRMKIPFYSVYSDLMHISEESLNSSCIENSSANFSYVLTIVCDYSKYVFAFRIKSKTEVPQYIKRVNRYIQRAFGGSIVRFHTDKGSEYVNKEVEDYFEAEGITHTTTNGYASMENGVAERLNLTLKNDIRTNLESSGFESKYWVDVLQHVVSIRNKIENKDTGVSPEGLILEYFYPDSSMKEIMSHKFKTLGRHGYWYDIGDKGPDLKPKAHNCFYLGPSYSPCLAKPSVLDGDKLLVFRRQKDGIMRPEVINSTNVKYSFPVKLYKECSKESLGITTGGEVTGLTQKIHTTNLMTNPPPMKDMMFVNFAPDKGNNTYKELPQTLDDPTTNAKFHCVAYLL